MSTVAKLDQNSTLEYKELRLRALQTDPEAYFATYEELSRWPTHFFESEILNGNSGPFGYYGSFDMMGRLRGYVNLAAPYFSTQRHVCDLYNLYVQPEFRRQHLADELINVAMQAAVQGGIETVFLSVMSHNQPAIELYKKYGFVEYGRKARSVKTKYRYLDEILMRRDLV